MKSMVDGTGSQRTHEVASKSATDLYGVIPERFREVGEAQFRRNLRRNMSPEEACRRRANQAWHGGYLYRITHLSSGRQYIGVTTTSGQLHRLSGHMTDARRGRGSAGSLEEAIRDSNFDPDAFLVEVLCRPQHPHGEDVLQFTAIDKC